MKNNNKIAIIIATYARPKMLKRCVESIDTGSIILIYNDIKDIKEVSNNEKIVAALETNMRGAGVKALGGDYAIEHNYDYLVFCDDDCFPKKGSISILYNTLSKQNYYGVLGGSSRWKTIGGLNPASPTITLQHTGDLWITQADTFLEARGIDPYMRVAEDYDYQLRVRIAGKKVGIVKNALFDFVQFAEGGLTSLGIWRGEERNLLGRSEAIKRISYKYPGVFIFAKYFCEQTNAINQYCKMYQNGLIILDRFEGVMWKR